MHNDNNNNDDNKGNNNNIKKKHMNNHKTKKKWFKLPSTKVSPTNHSTLILSRIDHFDGQFPKFGYFVALEVIIICQTLQNLQF